jgi:hypothetical protein
MQQRFIFISSSLLSCVLLFPGALNSPACPLPVLSCCLPQAMKCTTETLFSCHVPSSPPPATPSLLFLCCCPLLCRSPVYVCPLGFSLIKTASPQFPDPPLLNSL